MDYGLDLPWIKTKYLGVGHLFNNNTLYKTHSIQRYWIGWGQALLRYGPEETRILEMYKGTLLCFPNFPKEVPSFHPYATNTDLFFPTSLYHLPPALPGRFCPEQRALRYPRPGRHGENNPESPDSHRQPRGTSGAPRHGPRPAPPANAAVAAEAGRFPSGGGCCSLPPFLPPAPRRPPGRAERHLGPRARPRRPARAHAARGRPTAPQHPAGRGRCRPVHPSSPPVPSPRGAPPPRPGPVPLPAASGRAATRWGLAAPTSFPAVEGRRVPRGRPGTEPGGGGGEALTAVSPAAAAAGAWPARSRRGCPAPRAGWSRCPCPGWRRRPAPAGGAGRRGARPPSALAGHRNLLPTAAAAAPRAKGARCAPPAPRAVTEPAPPRPARPPPPPRGCPAPERWSPRRGGGGQRRGTKRPRGLPPSPPLPGEGQPRALRCPARGSPATPWGTQGDTASRAPTPGVRGSS